jgi:4-hydroxy-L-threonine phosphate dehydrogenase PdxA
LNTTSFTQQRRSGSSGVCQEGQVDAITTGPINKAALKAAHIPYIGHTELPTALLATQRVTTMLTMYHDQGYIPIKTHGFERSVTVTLGLPIVRTSVDHGTAFDIAWQGVASEESMVEAIRLAAQPALGDKSASQE